MDERRLAEHINKYVNDGNSNTKNTSGKKKMTPLLVKVLVIICGLVENKQKQNVGSNWIIKFYLVCHFSFFFQTPSPLESISGACMVRR